MHERAFQGPLPDWARWNRAAAECPWTVGIEEEVMLLDPGDWRLVNRIDDVLAALPPSLARHAGAETHACVVELRTAAHPTAAGAAAELATQRRSLDVAVRDDVGVRAAVAGTHPSATYADVALSGSARHREVAATMRSLARREPTMALHVHVAVPDEAAAVRALDGLRVELPTLLAVSANSPYWRGGDSGFASVRTPIFSAFPRVGIARHFGNYLRYVQAIDPLLRAEAIPEPGFVWWDARLQPRLGTVEVRIMDAQSRVSDAAALAALVQCRVRRHAGAPAAHAVGTEVLAENRFLAARDGMRARFIASGPRRRPARRTLANLLDDSAPFADELGCATELAMAAELGATPGDERQRAHVARYGLTTLPARLEAEFAPVDRPLVTLDATACSRPA
jgi:carboxylate-amine ligase